MPPSCSPFRCLVVLLLAAAAGFLARPVEASTRPFAGIVDSAARRHGVDPDLVHAVIAVESGYRASAQSPAGAQGLMQLMPSTQRDLGVADAFDPHQNVDAGVAYLRRLTDQFGTVLALAAYNAGPGAVRRYNGIPPFEETRAYVRAVLDQAAEEHAPSRRDRTHAEAGLADPALFDRRAQDDHLALDGAAGLEPQARDEAVDLDDRTGTAALPDQLVNPRGAQAGALRQVAADEPLLQVKGAGAAHAAADTARLVLHHGTDRLAMDAELRRDDPGLPVLAAMQTSDPGALRGSARRPSSAHGRRAPTSGSGHHVASTPASSHRGWSGARSSAAASPRFKMRSHTSDTDASALPGHFEQLANLATTGRSPAPAAGAWPPMDSHDRDQPPRSHGARDR